MLDLKHFQRLILESWYTNLKQTSLNRRLQLPAPYKRLFPDKGSRRKTQWKEIYLLEARSLNTSEDMIYSRD